MRTHCALSCSRRYNLSRSSCSWFAASLADCSLAFFAAFSRCFLVIWAVGKPGTTRDAAAEEPFAFRDGVDGREGSGGGKAGQPMIKV